MERNRYEELATIVLDSAITVHREMGPGLLEAVYQHCLVRELGLRDVPVRTLVTVQLIYKGYSLNKEYIVDVLVENEIIIELKAVEGLLPVHDAQIISYLKLADKRLGFLINFNVPLLKNGFRRFVNKLSFAP